jgi:hypothetical protein
LSDDKAHETLIKAVRETGIAVDSVDMDEEEEIVEDAQVVNSTAKGKGKGKADETGGLVEDVVSAPTRSSREDREVKLKELRMRMVRHPHRLFPTR